MAVTTTVIQLTADPAPELGLTGGGKRAFGTSSTFWPAWRVERSPARLCAC